MPAVVLILSCIALTPDEPGSGSVVAPGAKLEKLWDQGSFTEGGALTQDGAILFSDIGDRIMRFDPASKSVTVFRDPGGRARSPSATARSARWPTATRGSDSTARTTWPSIARGGSTCPTPVTSETS